MALVGILPFGAIFVELYFIMNNMWFGKVYYMFGFLFLCYAIMIITTAAVTVLLVYFLLCAENYHWQWRAFCTAGASAGYVFANALLSWISKLTFGSFTSGVLYVGYSLLVSFLFFILTGMYSLVVPSFVALINADLHFQGRLASSVLGCLCNGFTGPSKSTEVVQTSRCGGCVAPRGIFARRFQKVGM